MSKQHGQSTAAGGRQLVERQLGNVLNSSRREGNENNAQARSNSPQHARDAGDALPPWFQAQLNLETGKNEVLRERFADEKKARIKAEKTEAKTSRKLAVLEKRHSTTVRVQRELTKDKRALVKENSKLVKENSKLKMQTSKLTAQKTELERANRALKTGENAAAMAKKLRATTTSRGRNNPSKVVKWERTFKDIIMDFRGWMGGKKVYKGRCPKLQVRVMVEEFLQHGRFAEDGEKKKLQAKLISEAYRIVDERKGKAVRGMAKHL
ncbi:hypothetical protein AAVH_14531 [Aphelenchoides avenae]|nr:hypothetical protein AAVH_14531 [Aphelenchus avenae]